MSDKKPFKIISTKIKPCLGNVLVQTLESGAKDEKIGGIYLPDSAKTPFDRGVVIAVGPGELTISGNRLPMPCEVGDMVMYYGAPRVIRTSDGVELVLIAHTEVHAVLKE